jgi:nucleotide-binding universal stress UspA family protein
MFNRILVPLDGSTTAETILPQVRRLLRRIDAEVVLLQVATPPLADGAMALFEAALSASREYLREVSRRLEEQGVRARSLARLGPPAEVVLEVARSEGAELLALATHGRTGVGRLLMGSVAEEIVRKSPVPALLLRPFWTYEIAPETPVDRQPISNILLPSDGSDRSLGILPEITELAKLFGARVVLLGAVEPAQGGPPEGRPDLSTEHLGTQLAETANHFLSHGLDTLTRLDVDHPASAILRACQAEKIDLIAMGTHGRTGLRRLVTGSVTERVLRESTVPMLIENGRARTKQDAPPGPAR